MTSTEKQGAVAAAVANIDRINALFHQFMEHLKEAKNPDDAPGGIAVATATGIVAICLKLELAAAGRLVRNDSGNFAIEFAFYEKGNRPENGPVWKFYLHQDGGLYPDATASKSTRICDFDNAYVKSNLLPELAQALLTSHVFRPI